jgi:hypothetical protein
MAMELFLFGQVYRSAAMRTILNEKNIEQVKKKSEYKLPLRHQPHQEYVNAQTSLIVGRVIGRPFLKVSL